MRDCHCTPFLHGDSPLSQKCVCEPRRASEVNISLDSNLATQINPDDPTLKWISIHPCAIAKGAAKPGRDVRILRYTHATELCRHINQGKRQILVGVIGNELPINAVWRWTFIPACWHSLWICRNRTIGFDFNRFDQYQRVLKQDLSISSKNAWCSRPSAVARHPTPRCPPMSSIPALSCCRTPSTKHYSPS